MTAPVLSDLTKFATAGSRLGDFVDWFIEATEGADCVVALARAAPRLLQYCSVLSKLNCPVVSERALGFLPPSFFQGKRVILFDDTINFGSTMAETRSRLVDLGAEVRCIAIAVDRQAFLGETVRGVESNASKYVAELNPKYILKSSTAELDVLHGLEIRAFRTMGKPYMFDFPIYEVTLQPSIRQCSPSYLARMLGENEGAPFIWTSMDAPIPSIRHFGIPVSSHILDELFPTASNCVEWQPFSKIRLFIDYAKLRLRLVPVLQLTSRPMDIVGTLGGDLRKSDQSLEHLLSGVQSNLGAELWNVSVHRSVVFALGCRLAAVMWQSLIYPALKDYVANSLPVLCEDDAAFVFGHDLIRKASQCQSFSRVAETKIKWNQAFQVTNRHVAYLVPPSAEKFSDPTLFEPILAQLDAFPELRPSNRRDAYENIGSLLPILRDVIDYSERASQDVARLLRGVTYLDLLTLLNSYGAVASPIELSSALDDHIDRGMLVPQLVYDAAGESVRRAYRSGETIQSDTTSNRKSIVHRLLKERADYGLPALSEFGFSKTFVILKKLFPELPYRIKPQTYGIEPYADDELLRAWCQAHQIIEVSKERIDNARRITPVRLPNELPPWPMPHATQYPIRVIFQQIADLDSATGTVPARQMYLLLSSCNNHQATFNGCAFELHNWFRRPFNNYDRFISILESVDWSELARRADAQANAHRIQQGLFPDLGPDPRQLKFELLANFAPNVSLPALLQQCRSYLAEYLAKRDLFYTTFSAVKAALANHFSSKPEGKMLWDEMFKDGEYLDAGHDPTFLTLFSLWIPLKMPAGV